MEKQTWCVHYKNTTTGKIHNAVILSGSRADVDAKTAAYLKDTRTPQSVDSIHALERTKSIPQW